VEVSKEALPRGRHSRPEAIDDESMDDLFDYGLPGGGAGEVPDHEVDAAVASALRRLRPAVRGVPLPWEQGYWGFVLGARSHVQPHLQQPLRQLLVPQLPIGSSEPAVPDAYIAPPTRLPAATDAASCVAKKRKITDVRIQQFDDTALEDALRTWRGILAEMGEASRLSMQLVACESPLLANRSFAAAFFGKPSSTLVRRAGSLRLYIRWAHATGRPPFPLSEDTVFRYFDDLNMEGAPPTRAASFKESLNFSKGYVGLEGVTEVLSSRRIQGAALVSFARKRGTRKRLVLTKAELLSVEDFLSNPSGPQRDRILAGFLLFCVYGRLRVGDASRISSEPVLDVSSTGEGYIESGMLEHKTSSRVKSRLVLPVAATAVGVGGTHWAEVWLALRKAAGLDAAVSKTLMQAPGLEGSWTAKRLPTSECTTWLRELLRQVTGAEGARAAGLGSHSLKATMLSWVAKFGLPAGPRRRLGGHVKAGDRSLVEYSRDEMAGPLRELDRVLRAVRAGTFEPDLTRSGRWVSGGGGAEEPSVPCPTASPVTCRASSAASSSSSSSSASEVIDTDEEGSSACEEVWNASAVADEVSPVAYPSEELPLLPEEGLVRNLANGVIHGARSEHRMTCGRTMPPRHVTLGAWPKRPWPLCRNCFRMP
jgi:hypothetical protein